MKRVLLLAVGVLLGCAPVLKLPPLQTVSRSELPAWVASSTAFPREFTAIQRILLTVNGKEYDFTGSLQKSRHEIQAVALAEMGSLFLHLRIKGDTTEIIKNPSGLPEHPLRDGVGGDIRFLFDRIPAFRGQFWQQNRNRTMAAQKTGKRQIVWQADSAGVYTASVTEAAEGRKLRTVFFSDYRYFNSVGRALPATIFIRNFRWHYTLRVQLLTIHSPKPEKP